MTDEEIATFGRLLTEAREAADLLVEKLRIAGRYVNSRDRGPYGTDDRGASLYVAMRVEDARDLADNIGGWTPEDEEEADEPAREPRSHDTSL